MTRRSYDSTGGVNHISQEAARAISELRTMKKYKRKANASDKGGRITIILAMKEQKEQGNESDGVARTPNIIATRKERGGQSKIQARKEQEENPMDTSNGKADQDKRNASDERARRTSEMLAMEEQEGRMK
jgi:hypothetical protein